MNANNSTPAAPVSPEGGRDDVTTIEAARLLGLAVRSVQLMVDRGDLQAWKTPGGHRRISRESLDRWRAGDRPPPAAPAAADATGALPATTTGARAGGRPAGGGARVLLIEDSTHYQNLISLLLRQKFPDVELRTATDGIVGLAMAGEFQPDVLMVDILLPGIDGATLITSLRSHPQFRRMQVIVVTSLAPEQLGPYTFALQGIPVVHKPRLVAELPALLTQSLAQRRAAAP
ncbi:MAG: response regulator [Rhodoferax sp.]|jgi:excisionase family DNA binding protein|nr:response regulator [Rhodoferax sp.]